METITSLSARSLQYFVIAKKWRSDIDFYKYEVKFLRSLVDYCFFNTESATAMHSIWALSYWMGLQGAYCQLFK